MVRPEAEIAFIRLSDDAIIKGQKVNGAMSYFDYLVL